MVGRLRTRGGYLTRLGYLTRNPHLWLPSYLLTRWRRRGEARPRHAWVAIADHFEPGWKGADPGTARERVARWSNAWPTIADQHRDATGRRPLYTFFFPQEEYRAELLDPLAAMTTEEIGDVEVHIHHDGGGVQEFVDRMSGFVDVLRRRHGLLREVAGRPVFGFIHGNWALDNARPDGRWCGLNNELTLLRDLGCYADFTLPAAPDPSQAGPVNQIFTAIDDPARPRSHDRGTPVLPGAPTRGDLTLIPGPLALRWGKGRLLPRLETGELAANNLPSPERARLWLARAPRIGEHVFVKLFAHGAQERNAAALLAGGLVALFESLRAECLRIGAALHYVSTWEMWQVVENLRKREDPFLVSPSAGRRAVAASSSPS